ncbi:MAG: MXAN_5187 C-terminal domain-containing protein [Myxococcota bacterium]|nr:hypothetical protein [Myxococcales bacterium]
MAVESLDEELRLLDTKLKQLKLDYEQYFLGARPREPQQLRREIQKAIVIHSQQPIRNTALRFRFNGINSRFQAFKRQWDQTLREIDAGTYQRHVFKANLHDRARGIDAPGAARRGASGGAPEDAKPGGDRLFDAYREAARSCGQDVSALTPEKLERVVEQQRTALQKKLGCDDVDFRVVVKDGKVKLKAAARR